MEISGISMNKLWAEQAEAKKQLADLQVRARIDEAKIARKQFVDTVDISDFLIANSDRITELEDGLTGSGEQQ